jgi:predicted RNA-binding Zn-ribbon protein involved in translation (DUF1610 family)
MAFTTNILSDCFANSDINQARALATLLNEFSCPSIGCNGIMVERSKLYTCDKCNFRIRELGCMI